MPTACTIPEPGYPRAMADDGARYELVGSGRAVYKFWVKGSGARSSPHGQGGVGSMGGTTAPGFVSFRFVYCLYLAFLSSLLSFFHYFILSILLFFFSLLLHTTYYFFPSLIWSFFFILNSFLPLLLHTNYYIFLFLIHSFFLLHSFLPLLLHTTYY